MIRSYLGPTVLSPSIRNNVSTDLKIRCRFTYTLDLERILSGSTNGHVSRIDARPHYDNCRNGSHPVACWTSKIIETQPGPSAQGHLSSRSFALTERAVRQLFVDPFTLCSRYNKRRTFEVSFLRHDHLGKMESSQTKNISPL